MVFVAITLWFLCASLTAGFILADTQAKYPRFAEEFYRDDLGLSWLFVLVGGPIVLVISIFMTGFYQHGFMNPFKLKRDSNERMV